MEHINYENCEFAPTFPELTTVSAETWRALELCASDQEIIEEVTDILIDSLFSALISARKLAHALRQRRDRDARLSEANIRHLSELLSVIVHSSIVSA